MSFLQDYYLKLANWLMSREIKRGSYRPWQGHSLIFCVASSAVLMWSYAILAYFSISDPLPGIVGFIMSTLHLLSPLLLKKPGNIDLATHTAVGTGIIHQSTFSYFTGGFDSNVIIWFGILPMIGGIVLGKKGVITWAIIASAVSGYFLGVDLIGPGLPNLITSQGLFISKALIVFGWIFLSTIIIYVFVILMDRNELEHQGKANKIRTLVRVLCHDISNPLSTIKNRLKVIQNNLESIDDDHKIGKVDRPLEAIQDIIEQIRHWEEVESGKKEMALEPVDLNEAISFVSDIFEEKLQSKNIKLNIQRPRSPILIKGNKTTLQSQILANIISNAIKFSEEGSTIDLHIFEEPDHIKTVIKDQGVGMPENILKNIFDAAEKTTRPGTQGERGTGFGLPIAKSYMERFGGLIKVTSRCKEEHSASGTIFELKFKKYEKAADIQ